MMDFILDFIIVIVIVLFVDAEFLDGAIRDRIKGWIKK